MIKLQHIFLLLGLFFSCNEAVLGQYNIDADAFAKITVTNETAVNTEYLEFSPFFYRDLIGFVYSNPKSKKDNNISEHFFDLAFSANGLDQTLIKRADFNDNLNSQFHEGPASFDNIKGILYYTRTYYDEKKGTSRDTIVRKIYQATERAEFADAKPLNLSNDRYSVCHPTISQGGTKMIFASNMPEGKGDMDLFSSKLSDNWTQTNPLSNLNTESNEIFPFLLKDSILFFASDRVGGLGGLDIYVSTMIDSMWSKPVALPYPINTEYDDFGLILSKNGDRGYFTSSRPGGKGKDDIYSFNNKNNLWNKIITAPKVDAEIFVIDKLTLLPIEGVKVIISDISLKNDKYNLDDFEVDVLAGEKNGELLMKLSPKENSVLDSIISGQNGEVKLLLESDKKYIIRSFSDRYEESYILFNPAKDGQEVNIILNPKPKQNSISTADIIKTEIYIPIKKNEVVIFNNIYYELNSAKIQQGAALELDALAKTMLNRPSMTIELSAHTDSRGKDEYNQRLSLDRANAAKQYLVSKGINDNRIKALGYGESKIRNHCKNTVKCSEDEHRYNRRTEVKIITE